MAPQPQLSSAAQSVAAAGAGGEVDVTDLSNSSRCFYVRRIQVNINNITLIVECLGCFSKVLLLSAHRAVKRKAEMLNGHQGRHWSTGSAPTGAEIRKTQIPVQK